MHPPHLWSFEKIKDKMTSETKIYIGNIPFNMKEDEVKNLFENVRTYRYYLHLSKFIS